ncbi:hypothetical protein ACFHWD_03870 [Clostridium sp. MT-14]|uniref:hypothetical protein n=1 Tax=Clostridium sp. MT-14 TaxID=3348360 RepID=UPI0035F31E29
MKTINIMTEAENVLRESIFKLDMHFGHNSTYSELLSDDTYTTVQEKLQYLCDTLTIQIEELYEDEAETKKFLINIKSKLQGYI